MFTIAKQTKLGYRYLEFICVSGACYFTYDIRNALTWGTKEDPQHIINDKQKDLKKYQVVELKPQIT